MNELGKNKRFYLEYKIIVSGTSTNLFLAKVIDKIIVTTIKALNSYYKQATVDLRESVEQRKMFESLKHDWED